MIIITGLKVSVNFNLKCVLRGISENVSVFILFYGVIVDFTWHTVNTAIFDVMRNTAIQCYAGLKGKL